MTHDKFCRFANDDRGKAFKGTCFDCQRLSKARKEERDLIAQEIDAFEINKENALGMKMMALNIIRGQ